MLSAILSYTCCSTQQYFSLAAQEQTFTHLCVHIRSKNAIIEQLFAYVITLYNLCDTASIRFRPASLISKIEFDRVQWSYADPDSNVL